MMLYNTEYNSRGKKSFLIHLQFNKNTKNFASLFAEPKAERIRVDLKKQHNFLQLF